MQPSLVLLVCEIQTIYCDIVPFNSVIYSKICPENVCALAQYAASCPAKNESIELSTRSNVIVPVQPFGVCAKIGCALSGFELIFCVLRVFQLQVDTAQLKPGGHLIGRELLQNRPDRSAQCRVISLFSVSIYRAC